MNHYKIKVTDRRNPDYTGELTTTLLRALTIVSYHYGTEIVEENFHDLVNEKAVTFKHGLLKAEVTIQIVKIGW